MFGDPVTNPMGWEEVRLGDVVTKIKSGLSRKLSDKNIGIPVIRSTNIVNGHLNIDEIKYWHLKDPQGAKTEDYFLKAGDLLVNFINSDAHIGKVCVYQDIGRPCIYTTNIFVLNLVPMVSEIWFNVFAMTNAYRMKLNSIIQPAVNQSSFTTTNFKQLKVALPPLPIQNRFADFVRQVDKSKFAGQS